MHRYTCRQMDNCTPTQCCFRRVTQPPSSDRGHATLHIVVAATHCFDKTVTETVIQVPHWPWLTMIFHVFPRAAIEKGGHLRYPDSIWQSLRWDFVLHFFLVVWDLPATWDPGARRMSTPSNRWSGRVPRLNPWHRVLGGCWWRFNQLLGRHGQQNPIPRIYLVLVCFSVRARHQIYIYI